MLVGAENTFMTTKNNFGNEIPWEGAYNYWEGNKMEYIKKLLLIVGCMAVIVIFNCNIVYADNVCNVELGAIDGTNGADVVSSIRCRTEKYDRYTLHSRLRYCFTAYTTLPYPIHCCIA